MSKLLVKSRILVWLKWQEFGGSGRKNIEKYFILFKRMIL